jgi:hypothetical protein
MSICTHGLGRPSTARRKPGRGGRKRRALLELLERAGWQAALLRMRRAPFEREAADEAARNRAMVAEGRCAAYWQPGVSENLRGIMAGDWYGRVLRARLARLRAVVRAEIAAPAPARLEEVGDLVRRVQPIAHARGTDALAAIVRAVPELVNPESKPQTAPRQSAPEEMTPGQQRMARLREVWLRRCREENAW